MSGTVSESEDRLTRAWGEYRLLALSGSPFADDAWEWYVALYMAASEAELRRHHPKGGDPTEPV